MGIVCSKKLNACECVVNLLFHIMKKTPFKLHIEYNMYIIEYILHLQKQAFCHITATICTMHKCVRKYHQTFMTFLQGYFKFTEDLSKYFPGNFHP